MSILKILQIIAAIGTIGTGFISLLWPRNVFSFTGLTAPGPRGITEIRSVLGGLFIGLGIAVFVLGTRDQNGQNTSIRIESSTCLSIEIFT